MPSLSRKLKTFRTRYGLSVNQLSKLTGISRRTLSRIEAGKYGPTSRSDLPRARRGWPRGAKIRRGGLNPRITHKLRRYIINACHSDGMEESASSDFRSSSFDFRSSPAAVLFHQPRTRDERLLASEFSAFVRAPLRQLMRLPTHDVGGKVRRFRMEHDLTLKETASLLDLSTSHLHAIETGARSPSSRTRFQIMRLITLPVEARLAERLRAVAGRSAEALAKADTLLTSPGLGRGGVEPALSLLNGSPPGFSSSPHGSRRATKVPTTKGKPKAGRAGKEKLEHFRTQLLSPPAPPSKNKPAEYLRYIWLTGGAATEALADELEISQPHLIRILRGDRAPSHKLTKRIRALTPAASALRESR